MSLVTRLSRIRILFHKNRPVESISASKAVEKTDVPLEQNVEEERPQEIPKSIGVLLTNKLQTEEESKEVPKEPSQPSYFGYLSGVVSSLWSTPQLMSFEQQKPPAEEKSPKVIVVKKKASRNEVVSRTKLLTKKLLLAESTSSKLLRIEDFNRHLMEYPASRLVAVQEIPKLIPFLLRQLSQSPNSSLKSEVRLALSLCGYVNPPKAAGVRVLSIDGGGTRGMMGLEVLGELERNLGGKIADHFDIIAGVSTGAIISVLLGGRGMKVREAKEIYMEVSRQLFNQGRFSGVSGLLLSHSYYNTKKWIEILKNVCIPTFGAIVQVIGEEQMVIDTARNENAVKLAIVSCIVNVPQLQPYVFRNYEHPAGRDSHFRGGTKHKLWKAIQASAAAPGYFEEVSFETMVHQDGGVLANNPTAIALHESQLLWPNEKIQCVVSVGNGRTVTELEFIDSTLISTGIQDKISKIVDSATDTELVHMTMTDLLDPQVYFRLNPYMSHSYTLDEIDPDRLEQMNKDARAYVRRNREKIREAALQLSRPAPIWTSISRNLDALKDRYGMYKPD